MTYIHHAENCGVQFSLTTLQLPPIAEVASYVSLDRKTEERSHECIRVNNEADAILELYVKENH